MFVTCLQKELLLSLKSARFLLTLAVFAVAAMLVTVVRARIHVSQTADHVKAGIEWRALQEFTLPNQFESWWMGVMERKAPNPLAIFAGGFENDMSQSFGRSYNRWAGILSERIGPRALSGVTHRRFIRLDLVTLIALAGSLMALLLVFDSVTSEREQGTLAIQLAGPVPRDTILAAKVAAGFVALSIPLVVVWIAAVAWVMAQDAIGLSGDQLLRLGIIAALSVLYVLTFFSFGMLVTCATRESSVALGAVLLAWVLAALVIPGTVPLIARHFAPIPPSSRVEFQRQAATVKIWTDDYPGWAREVMEQTGKKGWGDVWNNGLQKRISDAQAAAHGAIERQYLELVKAQASLTGAVSRISPVASFVSSATRVAGTGIDDYHAFVTSVDRYLDETGRAKVDMDKTLEGGYDPARWPAYRHYPVRLSSALSGSAMDVFVMIGLAVLCIMVGYVVFLRSGL